MRREFAKRSLTALLHAIVSRQRVGDVIEIDSF
jgi:hypothetical protein